MYHLLKRTATHHKEVTLASIIATKNPFTAGLLFHSFVDKQREIIAQSKEIYDTLTDIPKKYHAHLLKLVEDELAYTKIHAKHVCRILKKYNAEERSYGVWIPTIMLWHRILMKYLKESPLTALKKRVKNKRGYFTMSTKVTKKVAGQLEKYSLNTTIVTYVDHLLTAFERLLIHRISETI